MTAQSNDALPAGWISASTTPELRAIVGHTPLIYNHIFKLYACLQCKKTIRDVAEHFGSSGPHSQQVPAGDAPKDWATTPLGLYTEAADPYSLLPPITAQQPHAHIPGIPFRAVGYMCPPCRVISPELGKLQQHMATAHRHQPNPKIHRLPNIQSFFDDQNSVWFPSSAPGPSLTHPLAHRAAGVVSTANSAQLPNAVADARRQPSPAPSSGSDVLQGAEAMTSGPVPPPTLPIRPAAAQAAAPPPPAANPPAEAQRTNAQLEQSLIAAISIAASLRDCITALQRSGAQSAAAINQQGVVIDRQSQEIAQLYRALDISTGHAAAQAARQEERIDDLVVRMEKQENRAREGKEAERSGHAVQTEMAEVRRRLEEHDVFRVEVGHSFEENRVRVEGWEGRLEEVERLLAGLAEVGERPGDSAAGPSAPADEFSPVPIKSSPKHRVDGACTAVGAEVGVPINAENAIPIFASSPSQSDEDAWAPRKSTMWGKKRSLRRIMSEEASEAGEPNVVPVEKAVAAVGESGAGAFRRDTKRRRMGEAVQDGRVNAPEPKEDSSRGVEQPFKAQSSSNVQRPSSPASPATSPRCDVPLRRLPMPKWKRL